MVVNLVVRRRTSGNFFRRFEMHLGVERRAALWSEGIREDVRTILGAPRAELLKTIWLATSWRRL